MPNGPLGGWSRATHPWLIPLQPSPNSMITHINRFMMPLPLFSIPSTTWKINSARSWQPSLRLAWHSLLLYPLPNLNPPCKQIPGNTCYLPEPSIPAAPTIGPSSTQTNLPLYTMSDPKSAIPSMLPIPSKLISVCSYLTTFAHCNNITHP